jgi:sialate O-acetylesterase
VDLYNPAATDTKENSRRYAICRGFVYAVGGMMRKTMTIHRTWRRLLTALLVCVFSAAILPAHAAGAALKLASIFGDDMVLQRDRKICVWGEAPAGSEIRITLARQDMTAKADDAGHWKTYLEPLPAGGPHQLEVHSGTTTLTVNRILAGDVWLCAGQSNMAMALWQCEGGEAEAKHANRFPRLRLCTVAKGSNAKPQTAADIKWRPANEESAREFSGVAFFFASELLKDPALAEVPIAVIDSSFGGTTCEGWIPPDALAGFDAKQLRPSLFGQGPAHLYNAMIAPLVPAGIKGIVWYQGESNADRPVQYVKLLSTMMAGWRKQFEDPSLPFIIIQLPDWAFRSGNLQWTWIREAQEKAVHATPGAMLATAIDTTDGFNLHPKEKHELGRRAALLARHDVYKEDGVVARGPVFKDAKIEGSRVRMSFDAAGDGLAESAAGNAIRGFALAGPDGHYRFADATIDGDTVVVQCKDVPAPKTVRYAWAGVPRSTLTNRSGLPAAPFRTDDLPPTADVELQRQPSDRRLVTSAYDITIDCYGRVCSFGVRGKQFLSNGLGSDGGTSIPAWLGPRPLYQISEIGPDVVSFSDTQVTLTLAFKDDAMTWTLNNAQKDDITFRIALAPQVNVPALAKGEPLKLSRGKSVLVVGGIDAVTDSEEGKVLQVTVKGNAQKQVIFTVPPQ